MLRECVCGVYDDDYVYVKIKMFIQFLHYTVTLYIYNVCFLYITTLPFKSVCLCLSVCSSVYVSLLYYLISPMSYNSSIYSVA